MECDGTGEAHGQETKGSEGALSPCHGGGGVSNGRGFEEAVAAAERSVRARSSSGKKKATRGRGEAGGGAVTA
jgi:hypothetical protein